MPPAPTISEIARRAGVGTATVDRVLNRRPGVNPETVQKVMQAVVELGTPQQPGRPRSGEQFRFAFVLPADPFPHIDIIDRQIAQAAGDFRHQHITEITHRFDTAEAGAFAEELLKLRDCHGIAVMAPDLPPVKLAINELRRGGCAVVTLLSDVAGSMRQAYIGTDNRAAGRTAGLLLARMARAGGRDTLLLSSQATRMSGEIERRIGFAQVLEERFASLRMVRTPDLPAGDGEASAVFGRFLGERVERDRLAGIYNVGTATGGIVQAVAAAGLAAEVAVVGHDFTEENRILLSNGGLAYLLQQDIHYCVLAAARVLRALCENVRGALDIVLPRVEILTAENMV